MNNIVFTSLRSGIRFLLYILMPYFCRNCKMFLQEDTDLCYACFAYIEPITTVPVRVTRAIDVTVFTIGTYQDPLRFLILAKSWSDRSAAVVLGKMMWNKTNIASFDFDYLVPVPLHWTRKIKRGYNQAHVIAKQISVASGKPIVPLVNRSRFTYFQSKFGAAHRQMNVKHAFTINERYRQRCFGKKLLLVDDLMTTGATIQAIANVLLDLNPAALAAAVAARVV